MDAPILISEEREEFNAHGLFESITTPYEVGICQQPVNNLNRAGRTTARQT